MERDTLWVRVLAAKYTQGKNSLNVTTRKKGASNAWQGITKTAHVVQNGCRTQVRNGRNTHFWTNPWIDNKSMAEILEFHNVRNNMDIKVADLWDEMEGWKWAELPDNLPNDISGKMELIHLQSDENAHDEKHWMLEASGMFSVSSAYSN